MRRMMMLAALAAATSACGEEGDALGDGTVSAPWDTFCVATFTRDYAVTDAFGDPGFQASEGDSYLIGSLSSFGGAPRAELLFLTREGPIGYRLELNEGDSYPFTTNCEAGQTRLHLGVFVDTTFYEDVKLKKRACTLSAGTYAPSDSVSLGLAGDLDFGSGDAVYEVSLGGLTGRCGGREKVFVQAHGVQTAGGIMVTAPVASFVGPREVEAPTGGADGAGGGGG